MAPNALTFKVLLKFDQEQQVWITHCLELDLVASSNVKKQAKEEIIDVIKAHVKYAFENNNIEYLFSPAPQEIWDEYFASNEFEEHKSLIVWKAAKDKPPKHRFPSEIIAQTGELRCA
ncbi:MAG TPA: hypothetical protein VM123_03435 [archaeon]|nr:hypothetical protein [archaeon]